MSVWKKPLPNLVVSIRQLIWLCCTDTVKHVVEIFKKINLTQDTADNQDVDTNDQCECEFSQLPPQ